MSIQKTVEKEAVVELNKAFRAYAEEMTRGVALEGLIVETPVLSPENNDRIAHFAKWFGRTAADLAVEYGPLIEQGSELAMQATAAVLKIASRILRELTPFFAALGRILGRIIGRLVVAAIYTTLATGTTAGVGTAPVLGEELTTAILGEATNLLPALGINIVKGGASFATDKVQSLFIRGLDGVQAKITRKFAPEGVPAAGEMAAQWQKEWAPAA